MEQLTVIQLLFCILLLPPSLPRLSIRMERGGALFNFYCQYIFLKGKEEQEIEL
jgi:hypothetical protein